MVRWKPTGLHKHFRMLSIHRSLLSHGLTHPSVPHTRPRGIWAKLSTLYDLPALDRRENAHAFASLPDPAELAAAAEEERDEDDEDEEEDEVQEFTLPEEEFGAKMWSRRYQSKDEFREAEKEPYIIPGLNSTRQIGGANGFTVHGMPSELEEPGEDQTPKAAATPSTTSTRKQAPKANTAVAKVKASAATARSQTRRGSRGSKAESAASTPAVADDDDDEDEGDETGDNESVATTGGASEAPAAPVRRGRNWRRGTGKAKEPKRKRR
ncbi:hypothetical protein K402DRAFT_387934 [Aulographum hederae CBS 113979]|uniref:CT20-domain-containing protein n=1 Tax=Aulographum hederae CBS 113979 TaxID=1176131 RepID=A0A6G1HGJ1_9PEZI|nr:hypothetical protein K402DRAFT_387934 [Aulographum hederae CBS 113979]